MDEGSIGASGARLDPEVDQLGRKFLAADVPSSIQEIAPAVLRAGQRFTCMFPVAPNTYRVGNARLDNGVTIFHTGMWVSVSGPDAEHVLAEAHRFLNEIGELLARQDARPERWNPGFAPIPGSSGRLSGC